MFGNRKHASQQRPRDSDLRCSFCAKGQDDVRKLIAGPAVFICDECITACNEIIEDDSRGPHVSTEWTETAVSESRDTNRSYAAACSLCRLPLVLDEALSVP